jgi:hypothetical protein
MILSKYLGALLSCVAQHVDPLSNSFIDKLGEEGGIDDELSPFRASVVIEANTKRHIKAGAYPASILRTRSAP